MRLPIPFIHRWHRMNWGKGTNFDCRQCRICGRFEVYAYGYWSAAERAEFEPVRERGGPRPTDG